MTGTATVTVVAVVSVPSFLTQASDTSNSDLDKSPYELVRRGGSTTRSSTRTTRHSCNKQPRRAPQNRPLIHDFKLLSSSSMCRTNGPCKQTRENQCVYPKALRLLKAFKQDISEARVPLREAKTTPAATDCCSHKHG